MALKWTQSKLTKAIGLASIVGAATALSPAAQALQTDFGVEYRATGFYAQSDAFKGTGNADNDNGFAHLIRLKSDFLDEDTGISLHTSVEVAGDRWSGDKRATPAGPQAFNKTNEGDNVRLDLGYIQMPLGNTVVRVGRQAASYNNCFLVCDDRRDRALVIQPLSKTTQLLALYDRRQDANTFLNADDGDQFALGVVSQPMGLEASALYVKWLPNYSGDVTNHPGTPYVISGMDLFSGYVSGDIGEVAEATVGMIYISNGNVTHPVPANDGQYFRSKATSEYVRLEGSAGVLDWGVQFIGAQNGGLISTGFDTYSSLINSNPESTANPTSMYSVGRALGMEDFDQQIIAGKLTWNATPKLAITGALGQLDIDNGTVSDDSMFYDLKLSYQVNKSLRTWVTYGLLEKNKADVLSGNDLLGPLPSANFTNDDVQAASLNMAVSF